MENKWVHCMYAGGRGGAEVYMHRKIVMDILLLVMSCFIICHIEYFVSDCRGQRGTRKED